MNITEGIIAHDYLAFVAPSFQTLTAMPLLSALLVK